MDQGPCQARAALRSPWGPGLPEEDDAKGTQIRHPALLSAALRPPDDRLLFARPDDGTTAVGVR